MWLFVAFTGWNVVVIRSEFAGGCVFVFVGVCVYFLLDVLLVRFCCGC